jgi:N-acetyl-gamma-glutamyl-phosphate reductase
VSNCCVCWHSIQAEVAVITSRSEAGVAVADMYPNLRGHYDGLGSACRTARRGRLRCGVLRHPRTVCPALAGELLAAGPRSSTCRRLPPAGRREWGKWYGQPHGAPELLKDAVYGLPEVNREKIRQARLIAVPGCYRLPPSWASCRLLEAGWPTLRA